MKTITLIFLASLTIASSVVVQRSTFTQTKNQTIYTDSNKYGQSTQATLVSAEDELMEEEWLMIVKDVSGREDYAKVRISACVGQRVFAYDPSQRLCQGFYTITGTSGDQCLVNMQLVIYKRLPSDLVKIHTETFENPDALMTVHTHASKLL